MLGSDGEHRCDWDDNYNRGDRSGEAVIHRGETSEGVILEVQEVAYFELNGSKLRAGSFTREELIDLVELVCPWVRSARAGGVKYQELSDALNRCPFLSTRRYCDGYPSTYWILPGRVSRYIRDLNI